MNLEQVFDKAKTQSILDVMPGEMIVWKGVTTPSHARERCGLKEAVWYSAFGQGPTEESKVFVPYSAGVVTSEPPGFHSFVRKVSIDLMRYRFFGKEIAAKWQCVSALVRKDWITTLGVEGQNNIVIVSSKIVMPSYPNTDITKELGQVEAPDVERVEALAGVRQ